MDMNDIMAQAQRMQAELAAAQNEIQSMTFTATAGGGVVEATATGNGEIAKLRIDPEVVDPDDVDMLQDLVLAAVNEALRGVAAQSEQRLGSATGGLDLGALGGLF